jgi:hypothetical protein
MGPAATKRSRLRVTNSCCLRACLRGVALTIVFTAASSTALFAQIHNPTEFQVKAAYLYNFSKFVKWPPQALSADRNFNFCILGSNPFDGSLDAIVSGEAIEGRRMLVVRISNIAESQNCRILFVGGSEHSKLESVLAALRRSPVLTVSDIPGFLEHDGIIQFVMQADKVRFQVNLTAAEKAGLSLSSELLKVAVLVKRGSQAGQ